MKIKLLLTILALNTAILSLAQTELQTTSLKYSEGSASTISIHDPSIVCRNGQFTIWGSHLGVATSTNMTDWSAVHPDNNTFRKLASQGATTGTACGFADAFNTQQVKKVTNCKGVEVDFPNFDAEKYCARYAANKNTWINGNMWAPDIIYNETMKKWCMYMSLNGDHWSSIIILLTSNSATGPFTYQGPVVMGGFHGQTIGGVKSVTVGETDYEIATGETAFNARYNQKDNGKFWPNCIDPCVFFDEEGELWMTYGSWSGGIFILKLNKETGLRDYTHTYPSDYASAGANGVSDPYFGKKIAGGYYVSGEGSYVQHIGKYYYLFMSYGFFAPGGYEADGVTARGGGYDMRIFRSEKPEGPYVDANGTAATFTSYRMNYGANPNDTRGMRLMSAYNNWGPVQTVGERSQGHNSACTDANGRSFLVYHTKFNDGSVGHQVRIHQLFTNKNGWLVAAPFHYANETQNDEKLATGCMWKKEELCGEYHLLIHPTKQNFDKMEEATPILVTLNEDGKVTGDMTGSWTLDEGTSLMSIKLGTTTYNGVFCENMANGAKENGFKSGSAKLISFTAVCDTKGNANVGVPVWGYKMHPISAIGYIYEKNKNIFTNTVKSGNIYSSNLKLTFPSSENVTLKWTSSEPAVISETGRYNPTGIEENLPVTLTARMECGDYFWQKEYTIKAKAETLPTGNYKSGLVAYYNFDEKPSYNLMQQELGAEADKVTYSKTGNGKTPTLESDDERMGQFAHQYFGAMSNNSFSRMSNPLLGNDTIQGFTISAWVKRNDDNVWDALWSFYNSTTASNSSAGRLFLTGNSYLGYNDGSGNWFDINHPNEDTYTNIPVGEWALVTLTVGPTNGIRLYVNGANKSFKTLGTSYEVGSSTQISTRMKNLPITEIVKKITSLKYFYLGMGSFWGSADACFDDLFIYARELPTNDVSALKAMCNRVYDFSRINEETGIVEVSESTRQAENETLIRRVFDLSGRQLVGPLQKHGIYIKNGKKIIK